MAVWKPELVDIEPVRQHLHRLMRAGASFQRILEESGASRTTLERAVYGRVVKGKRYKYKHMYATTANAITGLAFDLSLIAKRGRVRRRGFARRAQALMRIGYAQRYQSSVLGIDHSQYWDLIQPGGLISARHFWDMEALYRKLRIHPREGYNAHQRQGISQVVTNAKRKGYKSPLQWDDIDWDE